MTRSLRVGVQLPEVERRVPWPEMRDIALAAEDVGFDSVWMGDHLLYRDGDGARGPWEAWSILAAIAAVTDRVTLGPLVASTSFHNPAMIAKKAVTIDDISDGRFVLGLGAGWNRVEYDAYGFPYDHRVDRFVEAFTVIRTLLAVGHVGFSGQYYSLRDCVLDPPARPGRPPIMIGSNGPRMLAATLPHVQMWNTWYTAYGNTPGGLETLVARIDDACREAGRDPSEVIHTAAVLVEAPGGLGNVERAKRWDDPPAVTGDREEIAATLDALGDAGVDELQLVVDPITVESVEWLGGVLERLRGR
jgi:alkanesulfonate monooxygenase SsuD/methylene tetrahydromethanopterin reductase-like flavin-dependent oxidoreductase (luciferase family)